MFRRLMRMILIVLTLSLAIIMIAGLYFLSPIDRALPRDTQQDVRVTQVDTSNYPEVTLFVDVADENGQPRTGLTSADFTLTEDGTTVDIASFGGAGGLINTALVIDQSRSMFEADKLEGAQDAATAFVEQMRPGDQTTLITFNEDIRLRQDLTSDQAALTRAINRVDATGGTALYDGIVAGVDALSGVTGRRVLLVLTDGQDCRDLPASICPNDFGSATSLNEAIDYANQFEQPVYVVGLGDRAAATDAYAGIEESVLQRIATDSYGSYFYAPDGSQLAALYADLSGVVQNEYQLTYTSPRPFYDGTRRDLQLEVAGISSSGSYLERHLINVDSHPLVGLALLFPLLGLLLLPTFWNRGEQRRPASVAGPGGTLAIDPGPTPALRQRTQPASIAPPQVQSMPVQPAPQPAEQPQAAPAFCDQCGTAVRANARFCSRCGSRIGDMV